MPARHRSRQRALQVLFLWDQRRQNIEDAISAFYETLSSEEDEPKRADCPSRHVLHRGLVEIRYRASPRP